MKNVNRSMLCKSCGFKWIGKPRCATCDHVGTPVSDDEMLKKNNDEPDLMKGF